jgi:hypothetical protein
VTAPGQARLPGHPGPTAEAIQREETITQAFVVLARVLSDSLEMLPAGSQSLTIARNVAGWKYRLTISPKKES